MQISFTKKVVNVTSNFTVLMPNLKHKNICYSPILYKISIRRYFMYNTARVSYSKLRTQLAIVCAVHSWLTLFCRDQTRQNHEKTDMMPDRHSDWWGNLDWKLEGSQLSEPHIDHDNAPAHAEWYHLLRVQRRLVILLHARRCANHAIHGRFNPVQPAESADHNLRTSIRTDVIRNVRVRPEVLRVGKRIMRKHIV